MAAARPWMKVRRSQLLPFVGQRLEGGTAWSPSGPTDVTERVLASTPDARRRAAEAHREAAC